MRYNFAVMVKIYTKGGDCGTTSLFGGKQVNKSSTRIAVCGTVDELNSQIGVIIAQNPPADIIKKLLLIQGGLFVLGWDLSTPIVTEFVKSKRVKVKRISKKYITRLEREIDGWTKELPEIKNFILPGGGKVGAQLHLARAITRRTEREIVKLSGEEKINENILPYINRLSDWFFVLARYANQLEKIVETYWRGRK